MFLADAKMIANSILKRVKEHFESVFDREQAGFGSRFACTRLILFGSFRNFDKSFNRSPCRGVYLRTRSRRERK